MSKRGKLPGVSKTIRHAAHATEINGLMRRFGPRSKDMPTQEVVDLVGMPQSLDEARNRICRIESAFSRLPAVDRDFHRNDALAWADYVNDPANYKECVERGYLPAPKVVQKPDLKKAAKKAKATAEPDSSAAKPA